jgi:mono/diheme cytochrome c family protein
MAGETIARRCDTPRPAPLLLSENDSSSPTLSSSQGEILMRTSTFHRPLLRTLAPAVFASLLAPSMLCADAASDQVFLTKVWPIIDKNCTSCHGADKQKGKLRLDSRDAWIAGGEDGKIVVAGSPDKSDVILAIKYMAKDDDHNMPPKKKTRLTADQVDILSQWIAAGLPWPAKK